MAEPIPISISDNIPKINTTLRHRLWLKYNSIWNILKRCYLGGYQFRPILSPEQKNPEAISFLRRHIKETDEDFIARHNASYYVNHLKKIYDRFAMYIFGAKSEIIRKITPETEMANEYFTMYIDDFDLYNTTIGEYMEQRFRQSLVYGFCYSIIDRTYIENKDQTELEQRTNKPRAWATPIEPQQLVNWRRNQVTGEFEWILVLSYEEDKSNPDKKGAEIEVYYYYDINQVIKIGKDNKIHDGFPRYHDLGKVPIVECYLWDFDLNSLPEPFSQDIADLCIEHYNIISLMQEELDNATFPLFIIPKKEMTTTEEKAKELRKQDEAFVTGVGRAIRVDKDAKITPSFVPYPTGTLDFKKALKRDLVEEMEQLAHEKASQIAESQGVVSGFGIHQQQSKKFMFIALMAQKMQEIETKHWDLILEWDYESSDKAPQITPEYPTKFDAYDSAESRENLKIIIDSIPSATLKTEATLKWVKELYPTMDYELENKVKKELEEYYKSDASRTQGLNGVYGMIDKLGDITPKEPETDIEESIYEAEGAS